MDGGSVGGAAGAAVPSLFTICFGAFGLAALALWIWVLVDCITKEPSGSNEKIMWILIIVFTTWIGALIYYFVRRPQRIKEHGQ